MPKILITADTSPLIGRMLCKLSCFNEWELIPQSNKGRFPHSYSELTTELYTYAPTLVITRHPIVMQTVIDKFHQSKVILLLTAPHDTYQKFWMKAFDLDMFLNSSEKHLIIR